MQKSRLIFVAPHEPIELPLLARIAREVGDYINAWQPDICANRRWVYKNDHSPFSHADQQANLLICALLARYFPDIPVVSEENTPAQNAVALQAHERFDVDPLDNTQSYIQGLTGFSVNIARVRDGVPVAGAVYFPGLKEHYFTGQDGRSYLQKQDDAPRSIYTKSLPLRRPLRVAGSYRVTDLPDMQGRACEYTPHSGQHRTCAVASGECDITCIMPGGEHGFKSWDVAAPQAVLRGAGGELVTRAGAPLRYPGSYLIEDCFGAGAETLRGLGFAVPEAQPRRPKRRA